MSIALLFLRNTHKIHTFNSITARSIQAQHKQKSKHSCSVRGDALLATIILCTRSRSLKWSFWSFRSDPIRCTNMKSKCLLLPDYSFGFFFGYASWTIIFRLSEVNWIDRKFLLLIEMIRSYPLQISGRNINVVSIYRCH